ncbi:MAG: ribokinase [Armatimonadota bacterium]|nr:ribokinase [Armatimonadota bacterium]MDR5703777.1 ribokinase [Armatimonadota bacterium]
MKTIAVVGSIITDLAVLTPRLPRRGENILAHRLQIGPGGKGANAAVAVARLGARAILVGRVGNDEFGREELAALRAEGVHVDAVGIDPEVQTGTAIILVDDEGENTILVIIGANAKLTPSHVEEGLAPHWQSLDALLVNFEVPPETVAAAVEGASSRGIPVIVDAGPPRTYGPEIWAKATVISPNELELSTLVGYPVAEENQIQAARELLKAGPKAVVLKLGARGSLLVTEEEVRRIPAFQVHVVDTTGAGDAFSGGLAVALAEGMPLHEAVRFANAAGALATTRVGTLRVMPWRAEVEQLLKNQPDQ